MESLDNIRKNQFSNKIVIDTDVLIRMFKKTLSLHDFIRLNKTKESIKADLCISVFTYFEFFKGVKDNFEYKKRLEFLLLNTNGLLNYKAIELDRECNPEFWLQNNSFNCIEFKKFYSILTSKVYKIVKEFLISLIDGIVAVTLLVKTGLGKISKKCLMHFAACSLDVKCVEEKISIIANVIDKNYSEFIFDKKRSKDIINQIILFAISLFNIDEQDVNLFVPTCHMEIQEFLSSKKSECVSIKEQKNISCKSSSSFVESYLKHLNRNNEKCILTTGFAKLTIDYFNGRAISTNDLIDLFNIYSIESNVANCETFYITRENYWNKEFIDKYAKNENKIWKCKILRFK